MPDMDKCACGRWKGAKSMQCKSCSQREVWARPAYRVRGDEHLRAITAANTVIDETKIIELALMGLPYAEVARRCGCDRSQVSRAMRRAGYRKALRGKAFVGSVRHA